MCLAQPMKKPCHAPKRRQARVLPSLEELDQRFILNHKTGILRWRSAVCNVAAGSIAGSLTRGYISIRTEGVIYRAHRIVWKMHFREEPPDYLDHRNGVRNDNRPKNLRAATQALNMANARISKRNTSGCKGVNYHKRDKRYQAQLAWNGAYVFVGYYKTMKEARAAIAVARRRYHGEFAHNG
jgi:HNH endonuclease/AP2 domain